MAKGGNIERGFGYCRKCKKIQPLTNYYEAVSKYLDANNHMSICKKCISEIYNDHLAVHGSMDKALYATCEDLDIAYVKDAVTATQSHIEGLKDRGKTPSAIFGYYKSKLSSTTKRNSGYENYRFKNSDKEESLSITYNEDTDFKLDKEIIKFWGASNRFQKEDYDYLEHKFSEYTGSYECETPTMEELLKQAAFESLEIRYKRANGEDVSKHLKNLQDILGSANIKPNQESGANAADQNTFGTLIKKWENEHPIPEPDEEWKDVDGIGKYIRVWFLGHLCKMMGINNEHSEEYEKEMAKLRVEVPEDEFLHDDEEEEF